MQADAPWHPQAAQTRARAAGRDINTFDRDRDGHLDNAATTQEGSGFQRVGEFAQMG